MMQNGDTTVPLNADGGVMVGGAMMTPERTIVENAMNANNLTTVVAAVDAAGLVDTLNGPGPFTVFAPTNAAFDALPAGTVDTLLLPANKARLTNILTYHVVPGRYMAADLTDGMKLTTVQGDELMFGMKNGKMTINGEAMVEVADIVSSNGISHVIDTVLMPK
ncbi:MAG: fasciclin domain-containing protein [bacterium]|nr:fasciclin domain-containing protein [bacterium]